MPRPRVIKKSKRQTASRQGAFKSLRVSDGFRDFVLDQLSGVPLLLAKPMFGGLGLYTGDTFFGIVAADVLYLKVGDANRAEYERVGAAGFAPYAKGRASTSYYAVPVAVLEDSRTLARWVTDAIKVARQAS
jgi:DNA transformation protein